MMMNTQTDNSEETARAFDALVGAATEHEKTRQAFTDAEVRRNESIRAARAAGVRVAEIVAVTGVTTQRIHQVLKEDEA